MSEKETTCGALASRSSVSTYGHRRGSVKMIKKEKAKNNMRKYESYKLAFGMMKDALAKDCPLQVITIAERPILCN